MITFIIGALVGANCIVAFDVFWRDKRRKPK